MVNNATQLVGSAPDRRRLSTQDRRAELLRACLHLMATRSWDEVSIADVASVAGASKPLVYHYFQNKRDLYLATVRTAADELREATRPDPLLPVGPRLRKALLSHLDWIEQNAVAYRAVLQGGISSDPEVQAIVERSRTEVIDRLAEAFELGEPPPLQRIALRGWVGFLEGTSLAWLETPEIAKESLARMLAASASGAIRAAAG